ncbi:putative agmatine deiminase 1 [Desulfosarcina alkanivorans]|uniref:Putative agmatine deiminase n=2 Tax=Desulfosarcina alkanivorans TaxID=571177 RepID=A0A5K7YS01_9BACT|nr:putative agmatine deiminase 1 [Desulfosarcina alkanivorans]
MLWPERGDTWRMGAKPAQASFVAVIEAISAFEPVTVGAGHRQWENARARLPEAVRVVEMASDDAWMRDVGPTFVVNPSGSLRGVDWQFNAWGGLDGGLYFPWSRDSRVAAKVLEIENADRYRAPLVMEGGSFHVDGQGTLITTRECLLNRNRNPGWDQEQIEACLRDYLNLKKVIWLDRGVFQDETDGHVDNLCCFIKAGEVLLTWTDDPGDPQYEISRQAVEVLSSERDARGRALTVHKIHQPDPMTISPEECEGLDASETAKPRRAGDRLAASYVNFYMANGGIVMPIFNDPRDQDAVALLTRLFPERQVTAVRSREILLGGGNIHCITQQVPLAADRP